MKTDIVIPVRGTQEFQVSELFTTCVDSVCKYTKDFRFIFIDDASDAVTRSTVSMVADRFSECTLVRTEKQHWFTRAVNLGLRLVKTPYAVVLNCDTIAGENWLDELYAVKDEVESLHGKVGLVGSVLSHEEQRRYQLSIGQDYVTGHAWLLNMQAMQEASVNHGTPGWYLNETKWELIHIRSDVDICWELNALGWNCVKAFKSHVDHHGGRSWGHRVWDVQRLRIEDVEYRY